MGRGRSLGFFVGYLVRDKGVGFKDIFKDCKLLV